MFVTVGAAVTAFWVCGGLERTNETGRVWEHHWEHLPVVCGLSWPWDVELVWHCWLCYSLQ